MIVAARTRFPLVDSLRAIAALGVLGTHAGVVAGLYTGQTTLGPYAARLDVGITIFFLISGFLLYRPFVRARLEGHEPPRAGPYAWRRFLRIAPGYWVALTVVALSLSVPGVFSAEGVLTYYGFAQAYSTDTISGGMPQAWTLTVEVAFYAFLPLFAHGVSRVRCGSARARLNTELIAVCGLIALGVLYNVVVLAAADPDAVRTTPALLALPAYLDQFGLGMLLAVATVALAGRERLPRPLEFVERHPWAPWLVALVAFWASATQLGIDTKFFAPVERDQYFLRHLLYTVVGLGLLLPAIFGDPERGLIRRLLANRVLVYLGLISYGIYLYNLLVISKLDQWGFGNDVPVHPYAGWVVATLAGTTLMASLSWFALERPALRLKGRRGRTS